MIEKIDFSNSTLVDAVCAHKINEIIDWIDDVSALHITNKQVTANLPNIDTSHLIVMLFVNIINVLNVGDGN